MKLTIMNYVQLLPTAIIVQLTQDADGVEDLENVTQETPNMPHVLNLALTGGFMEKEPVPIKLEPVPSQTLPLK